jgi:hypothetical protein
VGLVNSRLSSLILYPILKKTKFIKEAEYPNFVVAEKKDSKITILSDINNVFRSFASVMLVLLIAYGIKHIEIIEKYIITNFNWIAILFLLILFVFSIRKQTKFVKDRVEANKNSKGTI